MERVFGTLQRRLPPELCRAGVRTKEAANTYLRESLVLVFNARCGDAAEPGSAFVAYAGASLDDVLCVQLDRQVGRDNCVSLSCLSQQIPAQQHRHHDLKATVRVHEYPDGRLVVFTARAASLVMTGTEPCSMIRCHVLHKLCRQPTRDWHRARRGQARCAPSVSTQAGVENAAPAKQENIDAERMSHRQLMRYITRTSLRATDRLARISKV